MGTRERRDRSDIIDRELSSSFISFANQIFESSEHLTLCAVGGYGRGELSPGSDLDILILHDESLDAEKLSEFVSAFLYPLWGSGRAIDHSVRSRSQTSEVAQSDIRVALGLLDIRFVVGNRELFTQVLEDSKVAWQRNQKQNLPKLKALILERAERSGELAFLLEPDLKESRGGLRDITALYAINESGVIPVALDRIATAQSLLSNVRDTLHEVTVKPRDQLMLTDQDQVALNLNFEDADKLMLEVAKAARAVDYVMDSSWREIEFKFSKNWLGKIRKREVQNHPFIEIARNPISPAVPWPRSVREQFVSFIGDGREMVRLFEELDQDLLISRIIPEWEHVRFLPQRNVLHRHTVDRHMLETVVCAGRLTRTVKRPDLLLIAAIFHDLGKGFPNKDHSEYGEVLIRPLAQRMGFNPADCEVLALLVREHLLLSAIATRRDLDDPETINLVVEKVKDPDTLQLLHALSISDGEATGRAAWSDWKANLVKTLVDRSLIAMSGVKPVAQPDLIPQTLVDEELKLSILQKDGFIEIDMTARDQVGLLAAIAGALSISRLEIRAARSKTTGELAVFRWTVAFDPNSPIPAAEKLSELIKSAMRNEIDLSKRIEERIESYRKRPGLPTAPPVVTALNDIATDATVIEVRMHDRPGVLYSVAKAISRSNVSIRAAIVSTLGSEAFDTLYVTDTSGKALSEVNARQIANQVENLLATHL